MTSTDDHYAELQAADAAIPEQTASYQLDRTSLYEFSGSAGWTARCTLCDQWTTPATATKTVAVSRVHAHQAPTSHSGPGRLHAGLRDDERASKCGALPYADGGRLLDTEQVAQRIGVTPATLRSYRTRGYLPEPDQMLGQSPGWSEDTILRWQQTRPGQGRRG